MSATLKDVADAVGTSITTVSKVLSGKEIRVSEAKRQEILETAERLKYMPTIAGVNLKKGCTDTVAVIVGDLLYPYYAKLLKELSFFLHHRGKSIIVCDIDNNYELEQEHYHRLRSGYVDGAIVLPTPSTMTPEHVQNVKNLLSQIDLPTLMVYGDNGQIFPDQPTVGVDLFQCGYLAGQHLAKLGHRRIAYVSGIPHSGETLDLSLAGFRQALEEQHIAYDPNLTFQGFTRYSGGRSAYQSLAKTDATAVVCSNDMVAIGLCGAAAESGKSIPGDLSLIGMDNIMATEQNTPKITTISPDKRLIAQSAAEQFFSIMDMQKCGKVSSIPHIVFSPELAIRNSTARRDL